MGSSNNNNDLLSSWQDYGCDFRRRRIQFYGDVMPSASGEEASGIGIDTAIRSLQFLDETEGSIELWINTDGGLMMDAMALYDVIQCCQNKVKTIGLGAVCSAGTIILAGGHERYMTENCVFMWHQPYGSNDDLSHLDAVSRLKMDEWYLKRWEAILEKHSNKDKRWWRRQIEKQELWLDAEGAIDIGVIDGIWMADS